MRLDGPIDSLDVVAKRIFHTEDWTWSRAIISPIMRLLCTIPCKLFHTILSSCKTVGSDLLSKSCETCRWSLSAQSTSKYEIHNDANIIRFHVDVVGELCLCIDWAFWAITIAELLNISVGNLRKRNQRLLCKKETMLAVKLALKKKGVWMWIEILYFRIGTNGRSLWTP